MKAQKINEVKNLLKPKEPTIDLTLWSDADLRILAAIQDKTGCKPELLTDADKEQLEMLEIKYLTNQKKG